MIQDKEALKEVLEEVLNKHREIDNVTHQTHHAFVQMCIEERAKRRELIDKIKAQVGGWVIISSLAGVGASVWYYLKEHLK